jgi:rhodanese-related sulfurtransferase
MFLTIAHRTLYLTAAILLLGGALAYTAQVMKKSSSYQAAYRTMSVSETHRLLADSSSSTVVLDVRTPEEFTSVTGRLRNALLLPVQELESRIAELEPYKNRTLLVYCRSGSRSARACKILTEQGFTVINMEGGILEWNAQGLPVER